MKTVKSIITVETFSIAKPSSGIVPALLPPPIDSNAATTAQGLISLKTTHAAATPSNQYNQVALKAIAAISPIAKITRNRPSVTEIQHSPSI